MKRIKEEKSTEALRQLREYRITGTFRPVEDFKAEFFRRAENRPGKQSNPVWQLAVHFLSAAAVVALAAGLVFGARLATPEKGEGRAAVAAAVPAGGTADPVAARMVETLLLFGSDTGVGYAGDDLFTFTRQESALPDQMLVLDIGDEAGRRLLRLELAVSADDYVVVDTPQLRGTIFFHRADRELQVVDMDVDLTLEDGTMVEIRDFLTLRRAVAGEMTAWNGYRIEPEMRPL